jgi:uncharacterized phage-associated protein
MERVDNVAAAFVDLLGPMPAMKLEKLVYYAQAWTAAGGRGRLFADPIEAWRDGPVVRHLYNQHRQRRQVDEWSSGDSSRLSSEAVRTVRFVASQYGHLTGDELSELTHDEAPWKRARAGLSATAWSNRHIPVAVMAKFYGDQVLSPEQAVSHARANAALEGLSAGGDFDRTLNCVAQGNTSADEVVAELLSRYSRAE